MNGTPANLARRGFLRGRIARASRCWVRESAITRASPGVLWGAAATDNGAVLVVGDDACILRGHTGAWSCEDAPTALPLHAVCWVSTHEVVAVGWLGVICEYRDGTWEHVRGGGTRASQTPLFGLCSAANGDVWAVGDHGRIVCRHDGQWHEHDSGVAENLRAVTELSDGRMLVTGANGICLIGDHDGWARCACATDATLTGLARTEDDVVYAVGARYDGPTGLFHGIFMCFDAHDWHDLALPPDTGRLRDVAAHGEAIWLVGDGGAALEYVGGRFELLDVDTQHDLHAVANCTNDDVLITGDFDTVLRQHTCANQSVPPMSAQKPISPWTLAYLHAGGNTLCGVWGTGLDNIFLIGPSGTTIRFDGSGWSHERAPTRADLLAVTGCAGQPLAVGTLGTAVLRDPIEWRNEDAGIRRNLRGLWSGTDGAYAVGDGGVVVRRRHDGSRHDGSGAT